MLFPFRDSRGCCDVFLSEAAEPIVVVSAACGVSSLPDVFGQAGRPDR